MLISADYMITGDGKTLLENQGVYVKEDTIVDMGPTEELKRKYDQEQIINYKGATLLPGLMDMHVHMGDIYDNPFGVDNENPYLMAAYTLWQLQKVFASGVTTIRDCCSAEYLCVSMNKAVEYGLAIIPRIIPVDMGICITGGHAWDMYQAIREADGPWEVRKAIRQSVKNGAQWIKLLSTHRTHTPEFTYEELEAAVDEAHRRKMKICVHCGTHPTLQMCIDLGVDCIEHGTFMTTEQASLMVKKGIYWDPTITPYAVGQTDFSDPTETEKKQMSGELPISSDEYFKLATKAYKYNFKRLVDTGIKFVAGTDTYEEDFTLVPVHKELQYMVNYGLEPLRAIEAATSTPAEMLGMADQIGLIKPGLLADLLIASGNPAEEIGALKNVKAVYYGGKTVYTNEAAAN